MTYQVTPTGERSARARTQTHTHTTDPRIKCGTISATMLPAAVNDIVQLLEPCVDRTEPFCRSSGAGTEDDLIFISPLTTSNPQ